MSAEPEPLSFEREYRWTDDARILTITAAPPGWYAFFRKKEGDPGYDPKGDSVHDLAWVEPIACFALVEVMEREQVKVVDGDGEARWQLTGRNELGVENAGGPIVVGSSWPHTKVLPVWLESGEARFPGVDEIDDLGRSAPSLIIGPDTRLDEPWLLKAIRR